MTILKPRLTTRATLFKWLYRIFEMLGRLLSGTNNTLVNPIFIIGTGRCGTTLLVDILKSHRGLAGFPNEANELWHPSSFPISRRNGEIPSILEDPQEFTLRSIQEWPRNHEQTIRYTFQGFIKTQGRPKLFFTKSAMTSFMIPKILEIFPDARFIHLYRSAPSVVDSLLKKEKGKTENCKKLQSDFELQCAQYWNKCILEIEKHRVSTLKEANFLEISYETLCKDPHDTLQKLSTFMGVDSNKFSFDFSSVNSTNEKVGDYNNNTKWVKVLEAVAPGMSLKGYTT